MAVGVQLKALAVKLGAVDGFDRGMSSQYLGSKQPQVFG